MRALALLLLAPAFAVCQVPTVGIIDFFGINQVSRSDLEKALALREGDPLPPSKADVEERLEAVKNVVWARLEATCCENKQAVLYVGIEERGGPHFSYRDLPTGETKLPQEFVDVYLKFLEAYRDAVHRGATGETIRKGHSLMDDPVCRAQQERFLAMADDHVEELQAVLRDSSDSLHRTVAAYAIGYVTAKKAVVNDLQAALRDPQDSVRFNALRSLTAILALGLREPSASIPVQPTWLVEMLHSLVWSDRRNAALSLVDLTETREESVLGPIREDAMPQLLAMARWKSLPHALPPYLLVGRAAGIPEKELQEAWANGARDEMLDRVESSLKKADKKK